MIQCADGETPGYYGRYQFWVASFGWGSGVGNVRYRPRVTITPNPTGHLIEIGSPETVSEVVVVDMAGRVATSGAFNSEKVQMDVSGLVPGMYMVEVDGVEAGRFVKQ
jgi:Secretion system C-terminal sorting domain